MVEGDRLDLVETGQDEVEHDLSGGRELIQLAVFAGPGVLDAEHLPARRSDDSEAHRLPVASVGWRHPVVLDDDTVGADLQERVVDAGRRVDGEREQGSREGGVDQAASFVPPGGVLVQRLPEAPWAGQKFGNDRQIECPRRHSPTEFPGGPDAALAINSAAPRLVQGRSGGRASRDLRRRDGQDHKRS